MTSKSLRRLAADHASLHNAGLPPNYLWAPRSDPTDDLTHLSVLLAGPEGTPYAAGVFALHLQIPPTYPSQPPTAAFKTRIWHPNIDESSGAVCVETLKRDWRPELTLRDVLVTIGCLLIQPNPASALNGEAGRLCEGDWAAFERRARMMVGVYARVGDEMKEVVEQARRRGEQQRGEAEAVRKNGGKKRVAGNGRGAGDAATEVAECEAKAAKRKPLPVGPTLEAGRTRALAASDPFSTNAPAAPSAMEPLASDARMDVDEPSTPIRTNPKRPAPNPPSVSRPTDPHPQTPASTPLRPTAAMNARSHPARSFALQTPVKPSAASTADNTPCSNGAVARQLAATLARCPEESGSESASAGQPAWLDWLSGSRGESAQERARREKMEQRRLRAAGFDLRRYNRGTFGPRRGLKRL